MWFPRQIYVSKQESHSLLLVSTFQLVKPTYLFFLHRLYFLRFTSSAAPRDSAFSPLDMQSSPWIQIMLLIV